MDDTSTIPLRAYAADQLTEAFGAERGRSAQLVVNDGPLRQTVIALRDGEALEEHNNPAAASLQVLIGRVRVTGASGNDLELNTGDLATLPHERHGVVALENAVFILTAVTVPMPAH